MRTFFRTIWLAASMLLAVESASATPSISRGELKLSIVYQDCMNRATHAFQSTGWVNIGQGGAFVLGFRGSEAAYITCNQIDNVAFTFVNVFVASDNQDSGVPGAAREQLQAAMMGGGTTTPGWQYVFAFNCCVNAWNGSVMMNITSQQGSIYYFAGEFGSELNGGAFRGYWDTSNGSMIFDRDTGGGTSQHYIGSAAMIGGKLNASGQWSGNGSNGSNGDWRLTQR